MSDFILHHVYQLTDFDFSKGHCTPPDDAMPCQLRSKSGSVPQALHIAQQEVHGRIVDTLSVPVNIDGMFYPSGSEVKLNFSLSNQEGFEGFSISIGQTAIHAGTTTAFVTNSVLADDQSHDFTHDRILEHTAVAYQAFACFAKGAMIKTAQGERAIEDLVVGDRVMTRDHGLQPIRWTGHRTLPAMGAMAPVEFDASTLGCSAPLQVSPNHRMLVSGSIAELLCGEFEMLVSAQNLINGRTVRRVEGGFVTYIHIMFDDHEVIWANDCPSESFYAGADALNCVNPEQASEILEIFPELNSAKVMQSMARSECRSYEASLISASL